MNLRSSKNLGFNGPDERKAVRVEVDLVSSARELGSPGISARVANISTSDCQLSDCDLPAKAEIWLRLPEMEPLRAHVVWSADGRAGCEFYRPLTHGAVARLKLRSLRG